MTAASDWAGRTLPCCHPLPDGRTAIIRAAHEDDAAELCQMLPKAHTETDFLNYMPGEFDLSHSQERDFIRDFTKDDRGLLLAAELEGRILGVSGAASQKFRRLSHHAEIGITVLREAWGLGIGRRMMELMIDWGAARGLHKLYLRVFEGNDRARQLYRSLGFLDEGLLRGDFRRADGSLGDTLIMARFYKSP